MKKLPKVQYYKSKLLMAGEALIFPHRPKFSLSLSSLASFVETIDK